MDHVELTGVDDQTKQDVSSDDLCRATLWGATL